MNDHADLDLIAAFREGLLDPAAGERVGRHLDGCALCAGRQAALDEVTSRLADAPAPPMPPLLARRLDAVLEAEMAVPVTATAARPARDAAAAAPVTATPPRRARSGAAARTRRRLSAAMVAPLAAAAAVSLLAGGYLLLHASRPSSPGTTSAAERSPGATGAVARGSSATGAAPAEIPGVPGSVLVVSSGTSYEPAALRADAVKVLQRYASRIPAAGKAGTSVQQPLGGSVMPGCLRRVSGNRQPLVVDHAMYEGRRAIVIIAPASNAASGRVWVVGLQCSATTSDLIAESRL